MSNWFSNLLPAIENAAKNTGKTIVNGVNSYGKYVGDTNQNPIPFLPKITGKQVADFVAGDAVAPTPFQDTMTGQVQNIPKDVQTNVHDQQYARPGETDDQFMKRTTKAMVAAYANNMGPEASVEEDMVGNGEKAIGNVAKSASKSPVRVTLKPSVYGAGREAAVQNTVDNIIPGATGAEKYKNLEPTMGKLGDQIDQIMSQNPKSAPLEQVMSDYDKNLANQGVYRTSGTTKPQIQKIAQKYITDLTNEASGNNSILNPSEISDAGIQNIKQKVNADAQSIFRKIENGTSLTDKDKVILAARQTLDDTLTSLHPEIKNLTTQQSHLYDAADSLSKAREAELKAVQKPNFLQRIKQQNPLLTAAEVGVAAPPAINAVRNVLPTIESAVGAAGALIKPAIDSVASGLGYTPKSMASDGSKNTGKNEQIAHTNSISQDVNGNYTFAPQSSSNTYMTNDQRQQAETGLTPGTPQYTKIEQKYADDQKKATTQLPNDTTSFMDNASTYLDHMNQTNQDLKTMPTDFLHGIDTATKWNAYLSNPNNPYAKQLANLGQVNADYINAYKAINGSFPDDLKSSLIAPGQSSEQVKELFGKMLNYIGDSYKKYQDPYLAVSTPTGSQTITNGKTYSPPATLPPITPQSAAGMVQPGLQQTIQSLPAIQ